MFNKIYISLSLFIALIVGYFYYKTEMNFTFFNPSYIDKTMIVISVILSTYIFTKIIDIFLRKFLLNFFKNANFTKRFFPIFHKILNTIIWIVWILVWLGLLGYNPITLVTWAWVWWVLIAIAGKETISNFFWSITLIFNKNFKIGDRIRIIMKKTYEWTVEEITLSYTKLIDSSWAVIYIPNKNLLLETIENLSQSKINNIEINLHFSFANEKNKIENFIEKLEKSLKKNSLIEDFKINFSIEKNSFQVALNIFTEPKNTDLKNQLMLIIKEEIEKQNLLLSQN